MPTVDPPYPPVPQFRAPEFVPPEPIPRTRRLWLAVGAVVAVAIGAAVVLANAGDQRPFVAPPGSVAITEAEQGLLTMHEAFGTLEPGNQRQQRAIIAAAHTLCGQLEQGVTTPDLWTAIGTSEGLEHSATYTFFAIEALCPQHAER